MAFAGLLPLAASVGWRVALGFVVAAAAPPLAAQSDTITIIETFAGTTRFGGDGGAATSATLNSPYGVAVDSSGNLYIADRDNHCIRKVDATTGNISTVAGTGTRGFSGDGGGATVARLWSPSGVALDGSGNLYIADTSNYRVRKVDAMTGNISTVAGTGTGGFGGDGGAAASATLSFPYGVALDSSGNLYIADSFDNRIRRVDATTGNISTVAGTGTSSFSGDGGAAASATLNSPRGVALDSSGNLYIADGGNQRIRRVDAATGNISTVAGTGTFGPIGDGGAATSASLSSPSGVALDGSGNLYIADALDFRIRRVDATTGNISTVAGTGGGFGGDGGAATAARLWVPEGVALDGSGNLYIADTGNHRVRKVDTSGNISTTAGAGASGDGGAAASATLSNPHGVALDGAGNLYIADRLNHRVRRVDAATGTISTAAGTGTSGFSGDGGAAASATLNFPYGVALDSSGNLYIATGSRIRKVDAATGTISTVAGTGTLGPVGDGGAATSAWLSGPDGVALDGSGNLYIAEFSGHRIRRVDAATGNISTVAGTGTAGSGGDGGAAASATLNRPSGVALDGAGNLYIADRSNNRVRRVDAATGIISTVAGTGTSGFGGDGGAAASATLNRPSGVALDGAGNLYIADRSNNRIRKVDAATGDISTVAGWRATGFSGDGGAATSATLSFPSGVAVDSSGNLYIADSFNHRIRRTRTGVPRSPDGSSEPSPPPNERPVAVGEFDDLDLDLGNRVEVSLLGKFRDPEGGALAYSAESLNPEVANAVVSGGRLWVDGRSPGLATVLVKATDSGGLSAQQEFQVKVGLVLTFAEAVAAAPEGGVARLKVELSRPSERTVSVGYVLEPDGDPATADADDADHGGSDGTLTLAAGETEAFIEVPVLDDEDIEPAREFLRVRLLAPATEADWALGLATAAVVIQEGVCDRTPEVRDGLRGSRECWLPSVGDLAGRGYLNLSRQGIASLRERDFLGLAGLRVLHLHGNGLAELPDGLFAGLGALERLRLDGNRLAELPEGLFEGLGRLSSLDLGGNRIAWLPADLLSGAPALSRLDLGGNRLSELPDGFFDGALNLSELDLSGNPGAPLTLRMELVRTDAEDHAPGPATVAARVAAGAPFALSAGLVAEGAELSADTGAIGAGEVSGAPIQVSLAEGGAARLSLSGAPEAPSDLCGEVDEGRRPCFQGLVVEAGAGLLLFKRPPAVVRAVPEQGVESLGGALSLNLAGVFAADGDDALTYSAESSDPALASVNLSGGVLSIEPNGEGLEGFVTVRLTATDEDGLEVEHSFTVEVSPPARSFGSGWRLGWLTGAPVPSAEAAPAGGEPE